MVLTLRGLDEIKDIARQVIEASNRRRVWLFEGEMGAGKTTLIKAICEVLGVEDVVSSPTFSIVNEYEGQKEKVIYHFDFYRIEDEEEAYDIGIEEYLYSGNLCLIEWPSILPNLLPEDCFAIEIVAKDEYLREVHLT